MSKFNNYARRLDNAAKKIFSEYQEAEAAFNAAESAKSNGPQLGRWRDAQTEAQVARLEADYLEAKAPLQFLPCSWKRRERPYRAFPLTASPH